MKWNCSSTGRERGGLAIYQLFTFVKNKTIKSKDARLIGLVAKQPTKIYRTKITNLRSNKKDT